MTKDVLVSAELAKEKLASMFERREHDIGGKPFTDEQWLGHLQHCQSCMFRDVTAQLIRNTDLTDCQREPTVEVWHGERKVTVYPGDTVLRSWGVNINHEMSDEPATLEAVQKAMDWLYEPQKAKSDE